MHEKTIQKVYATFISASGERVSDWWSASWDEDDRYALFIPTGKAGKHSEELLEFRFTWDETSPHPDRGYEYRILNRVVEELECIPFFHHHVLEPDGSLGTPPGTSEDDLPPSRPLA